MKPPLSGHRSVGVVTQNGFPVVLGQPHIVVCPWRHGAGEEVWSLIWVGAAAAHPRRRELDLGIGFAFLLFVVPVPRRDLPYCYGKCPMVKLDLETQTEKTPHHNPERRTDCGPGRFCCSRKLFVGGWLLLGGVEMCDVTVRVRERANENLFCEMVEDETDGHGWNGSASKWCSTSSTSPRTFLLVEA